MSKKKSVKPFQLMILTGYDDGYLGSGWNDIEAKPNPFVDEEEEIILPDGGSVTTNGEDVVIIPDTPVEMGSDADVAYY